MNGRRCSMNEEVITIWMARYIMNEEFNTSWMARLATPWMGKESRRYLTTRSHHNLHKQMKSPWVTNVRKHRLHLDKSLFFPQSRLDFLVYLVVQQPVRVFNPYALSSNLVWHIIYCTYFYIFPVISIVLTRQLTRSRTEERYKRIKKIEIYMLNNLAIKKLHVNKCKFLANEKITSIIMLQSNV